MKYEKKFLKEMQALPLDQKIQITIAKILEFYNRLDGKVYLSFSGGKDSTVLLDIVRKLDLDIEIVFCNTGLEFLEIQKFAKAQGATFVTPKKNFKQVITKYGYPMISKDVSRYVDSYKRNVTWAVEFHNKTYGPMLEYKKKYEPIAKMDFNISDRCCYHLKESTLTRYGNATGKSPITAVTAAESLRRTKAWLQTGCNIFKDKGEGGKSNPMSIWTEQDVLEYISHFNLDICSVYGKVEKENDKYYCTGIKRSGCIFCLYGAHSKGDKRLSDLKQTHPKLYNYCMNGGEYNDNGVWIPSSKGLGFSHVIEELNKEYGADFIKI